jgi:hypothetical protein
MQMHETSSILIGFSPCNTDVSFIPTHAELEFGILTLVANSTPFPPKGLNL